MCARRRIAVDAWDGFAAHLDACVEIRIGNVTDLSLLAPSSVTFACANDLLEHVSQGGFSAVLYHLRTTDGRWNVKYSATIYVRPLLAGVPVVTLAGLMQPTVLRGRTWPELIVAGLVCGGRLRCHYGIRLRRAPSSRDSVCAHPHARDPLPVPSPNFTRNPSTILARCSVPIVDPGLRGQGPSSRVCRLLCAVGRYSRKILPQFRQMSAPLDNQGPGTVSQRCPLSRTAEHAMHLQPFQTCSFTRVSPHFEHFWQSVSHSCRVSVHSKQRHPCHWWPRSRVLAHRAHFSQSALQS